MARFGKPDATGRSSGKRTGHSGEAHRPPEGEPWVWLTRELLLSDSWQAMSINTRRFVDFLCAEHMNHAGTENGALVATHEQLANYGLSSNCIRDAIDEAEFLGLVRVEFQGGRWGGTNKPSRYRLTFLPDRESNLPTNDWRRRTQDQIDERKQAQRMRRAGKRKRKAAGKPATTVPSSL